MTGIERVVCTHTSKSHSRVGSHVFQGHNERAMQREIDGLKKKLHHAQGNEPFPVITSLPLMKRMLVTGKDQELHQVSLFLTLKSTTTSEDTKARLVKAWETTL